MHHIETLFTRGNQPFVIGGLVTSIALGLNLGDRIENMQLLPPLFMDIDNCRSTRLIKNRRDGKFYLMVKNRKVPSVVLPNIRLTNVRILSTHLYNLDSPEQSEAVTPGN